jgi:hypothetical protein
MFILLVFDYRLENIKVHIRLVMCFHLLKLFLCCIFFISIMKYVNFICSFILDIQGTSGKVWPWEGSRHSHHWGYFSYIHFLTYLILLHPLICEGFYSCPYAPPCLRFIYRGLWIGSNFIFPAISASV